MCNASCACDQTQRNRHLPTKNGDSRSRCCLWTSVGPHTDFRSKRDGNSGTSFVAESHHRAELEKNMDTRSPHRPTNHHHGYALFAGTKKRCVFSVVQKMFVVKQHTCMTMTYVPVVKYLSAEHAHAYFTRIDPIQKEFPRKHSSMTISLALSLHSGSTTNRAGLRWRLLRLFGRH